MNKPSSKPHHGDLRETLIEAGLSLLLEGGMSALTLRKCAAAAGVSHAAPTHHFGRIEGLLTAIADRGYQNFLQYMLVEKNSSANDPRQQLEAICAGYLKFAQENTALYDLMFSSEKINFNAPDLCVTSGAVFDLLASCCKPFKAADDDGLSLEMAVWSMLHGYITLSKRSLSTDGKHPAYRVEFNELLRKVLPFDSAQGAVRCAVRGLSGIEARLLLDSP